MHKTLNIKDEIEKVDNYKYLGIIIDSKLRWSDQIDNLQKKLRKSSCALFLLKNCSNTGTLKQVYHALVESHLRYGITAWGYSSHTKRLQKSHNRVLKLMPKTVRKKMLSIDELYKITVVNTYYT